MVGSLPRFLNQDNMAQPLAPELVTTNEPRTSVIAMERRVGLA